MRMDALNFVPDLTHNERPPVEFLVRVREMSRWGGLRVLPELQGLIRLFNLVAYVF